MREGFIVTTCHSGTDWCVCKADERTPPDEIWMDKEDAFAEARLLVKQQPGSRWFDFSDATHDEIADDGEVPHAS